jgi:phage shock protein A
MPGLSSRISTLAKAKISHMLDRAEDPAEMLDYAYERKLEDLQDVNKGIADVVTATTPRNASWHSGGVWVDG